MPCDVAYRLGRDRGEMVATGCKTGGAVYASATKTTESDLKGARSPRCA